MPRVLFLSRWFAFFCICCITRSLQVLYSRANSLMVEHTSCTLISWDTCCGKPSHRRNRWNLVRKAAVSIFALCTFLMIKNVSVSAMCLLISKCYLSNYTHVKFIYIKSVHMKYLPGHHTTIDNAQNNNSLCTVSQELRHSVMKQESPSIQVLTRWQKHLHIRNMKI